jgi:hypothetical protein
MGVAFICSESLGLISNLRGQLSVTVQVRSGCPRKPAPVGKESEALKHVAQVFANKDVVRIKYIAASSIAVRVNRRNKFVFLRAGFPHRVIVAGSCRFRLAEYRTNLIDSKI